MWDISLKYWFACLQRLVMLNIFHVFIEHLHTFYGKAFIDVLHSLFNWAVWFSFLLSSRKSCVIYINILSDIYDFQLVSPIPYKAFSHYWLLRHNNLQIWCSPFFFAFVAYNLMYFIRNDCQIQCHEAFPLWFWLRVL